MSNGGGPAQGAFGAAAQVTAVSCDFSSASQNSELPRILILLLIVCLYSDMLESNYH